MTKLGFGCILYSMDIKYYGWVTGLLVRIFGKYVQGWRCDGRLTWMYRFMGKLYVFEREE